MTRAGAHDSARAAGHAPRKHSGRAPARLRARGQPRLYPCSGDDGRLYPRCGASAQSGGEPARHDAVRPKSSTPRGTGLEMPSGGAYEGAPATGEVGRESIPHSGAGAGPRPSRSCGGRPAGSQAGKMRGK